MPPGRYRWSPSLPAWAYIAGYAVYAGGLLFMLATPVILGSLAALRIARMHLEDRALRAELPGYEEYARRVKGRPLFFR